MERGIQTGGSSSSSEPHPSWVPGERTGQALSSVQEAQDEGDLEDFRPAEFGASGSSGSHGMQVAEWAGVYEDCFDEEDTATFPIVGSWLRVHFIVRLLNVAGEGILSMLGERCAEWCRLRLTSQMIGVAVAGSVVDALRRGPYWVMFSGPQWLEAVNEYLRTGYPVDDVSSGEGVQSPGLPSQGGPGTIFPYIEWPPGVRIHYLWRVFSDEGYFILSCLGTRVCEWAYLRAVAREFRSAVLYGLIQWLRATGVQYMSDTPIAAEAAEAFLQSGTRTYPFADREDIDDDPQIDDTPVRRQLGPAPRPALPQQ